MRAFERLCVSGSLAIAIGVSSLACDRARQAWHKRAGAAPAPAEPLPQPQLASRRDLSIADVVAKVLPSVVSIAATRSPGPDAHGHPFLDDPFFRDFFGHGDRVERGLGSGVVVSKDGVVLTNDHVVAQAARIVVTTKDGAELDAKVIGTDPQSDLAVIRLDGDLSELAPIALGDSSRLRLGDVVLAVGNPFGVGQAVTMGIVSGKGRANLGIVDYEDFIQTDAAINPGNSGGALVNMEGELIGISTAILSRHGGYMGIGFAIPSNMAKPIMHSLRESGRVVRGWLGVSIQNLDRDLAQALHVRSRSGVLVTDVEPGSPAARAGLARGDVIVSVDSNEVDDSGKFRNLIAASGARRPVKLELLRNDQRRTVSVALGAAPSEARIQHAPERVSSQPSASFLEGILLEAIDPSLRSRFRIPHHVRRGIVVTGIRPDSDAARAGLLPGDVVLEVDRERVDDVGTFRQRIAKKAGKTLLVIMRQGRTLFLVVS